MDIDPANEGSWIYVHFDDVMDTSFTGIVVEKIDHEKIPYNKEWHIIGGETDLILKPLDSLDYNTIYLFRMNANKVFDIRGNLLDNDNDGAPGESPDDNYVRPFITFKSDGSDGDWPVNFEDKLKPFRSDSLYFLINGKVSMNIWRDVDIAIDIYDERWNTNDTSIVLIGVDSNTINQNTLSLFERDSKAEVMIERVTYIDDTTSSDFGRVTIHPLNILKPGTWYTLRLLGFIADKEGNKLDKDSIAYEENFRTLECNHDSTKCAEDFAPPTIENWINFRDYFEVEFDEMIDESTITSSTIYLEESGKRVEGVLSTRNESGRTIVRFTKSDGNPVSEEATVSEEIKDLIGNRMGKDAHHNF